MLLEQGYHGDCIFSCEFTQNSKFTRQFHHMPAWSYDVLAAAVHIYARVWSRINI